MLIPFGVFSAAGAGGGGGGGGAAYELISTTYGTGSSGTISFTSIPSTYKHLQVRFTARGSGAFTGSQGMTVKINNASSNYAWHRLSGDGSSVSSSSNSATSQINLWSGSINNSETSGIYGAGIIDILDYVNAATNTTIRALTGGKPASGGSIALSSGLYVATAAVTRLDIIEQTGNNFLAASRFSLYGIKG